MVPLEKKHGAPGGSDLLDLSAREGMRKSGSLEKKFSPPAGRIF